MKTAESRSGYPTAGGRMIALALSLLAPSERYSGGALVPIGGAHAASRLESTKSIWGLSESMLLIRKSRAIDPSPTLLVSGARSL